MRNVRAAFLGLTAAIAFAAPVFADNDPSMQQIYDEARAGHLDQAQQMINQVLRDHPRSGKAHYVAAELAAKEGNLGVARGELGQAEQLAPRPAVCRSRSRCRRIEGRTRGRAPAAAPRCSRPSSTAFRGCRSSCWPGS
jgi:hypothetical protein